MNGDAPPRELASASLRIPCFEFPEDAARALAHAAHWAHWRRRPTGRVVQPPGCRPVQAAAIIARNLAAGGGWLATGDLLALLDCYGLPLIATRVVAGPDEAAAAAGELEVPVALKAIAPGLIHKSDAGGVLLGLHGAAAVRAGARRMQKTLATAGYELQGLVVQPMAEPGVELLVGVVHDASFGPVIACGAGGTSAELLKDVAVRITPLTDVDAKEMLRSLKTFPLLDGYRGAPRCDVAAVEDVLLRLGALVEAHPEVAELDANPLVARPQGALILDARARLSAAPPRRPVPSLRS
jgi:acyl-CoA synthetase (NDP forming)